MAVATLAGMLGMGAPRPVDAAPPTSPAPPPSLPSVEEVVDRPAAEGPHPTPDRTDTPNSLRDDPEFRRKRIEGYDEGGRVMAGVTILPFAAGYAVRTAAWVSTQRDYARCDPDADLDDPSQPDICGSPLGGLGEISGNGLSWGGVAASSALAAVSGTLYGRREWWALSDEQRAVRGRRFAIAGGVTVGVGLAGFVATRAVSWRYVLEDRAGPIAFREATFAGTSLVIITGAGLAAYGATMLTKTPPRTHTRLWLAPSVSPSFVGLGGGGRF